MLMGNHDWLERLIQMIRDKVIPFSKVVQYLPKILLETQTQKVHSRLVVDIIKTMAQGGEDNRLECAKSIMDFY